MNMAKASEHDLNTAVAIAQALESISGPHFILMPGAIQAPEHEDAGEPFDIDNNEHCRRVIEHLQELTRSASLLRVIGGMSTLLDPRNKVVDPDADVLKHHPEVRAALTAHKAQPTPEQIEQHLDAVLRAAGSALRHYTLPKSREDLASAMRAAMTWNTGATT